MKARSTGVALLAATVLLVTACSDDGGGGGGGGGDQAFSIAASLEQIPAQATAESGFTQVFVGDLDAATEAAGLDRPDGEDVEEITRWLQALTNGPTPDGPAPVFVPIAEALSSRGPIQVDEFEDLLGWSVVDVRTFVEAPNPPQRISVFTGSFDRKTIEAASAVEPLDGSDDFLSAGEGDDLATNLEERVPWDQLGRPLRMAVEGDRLVASLTTPLLEAWADDDETLADDPGFAAVAEALDGAGAVSAALFQGDFGDSGLNVTADVLERVEESMAATPFDTVGIGWSVDDGEAVVTVAYHFADDADASTGVEEIEAVFEEGASLRSGQPLSQLIELTSIEADGPVVVARLTPAAERPPSIAVEMVMSRDLPFVHRP